MKKTKIYLALAIFSLICLALFFASTQKGSSLRGLFSFEPALDLKSTIDITGVAIDPVEEPPADEKPELDLKSTLDITGVELDPSLDTIETTPSKDFSPDLSLDTTDYTKTLDRNGFASKLCLIDEESQPIKAPLTSVYPESYTYSLADSLLNPDENCYYIEHADETKAVLTLTSSNNFSNANPITLKPSYYRSIEERQAIDEVFVTLSPPENIAFTTGPSTPPSTPPTESTELSYPANGLKWCLRDATRDELITSSSEALLEETMPEDTTKLNTILGHCYFTESADPLVTFDGLRTENYLTIKPHSFESKRVETAEAFTETVPEAVSLFPKNQGGTQTCSSSSFTVNEANETIILSINSDSDQVAIEPASLKDRLISIIKNIKPSQWMANILSDYEIDGSEKAGPLGTRSFGGDLEIGVSGGGMGVDTEPTPYIPPTRTKYSGLFILREANRLDFIDSRPSMNHSVSDGDGMRLISIYNSNLNTFTFSYTPASEPETITLRSSNPSDENCNTSVIIPGEQNSEESSSTAQESEETGASATDTTTATDTPNAETSTDASSTTTTEAATTSDTATTTPPNPATESPASPAPSQTSAEPIIIPVNLPITSTNTQNVVTYVQTEENKAQWNEIENTVKENSIYKTECEHGFKDVTGRANEGLICVLQEMDIIKGKTATNFGYNDTTTVAEFIKMLLSMAGEKESNKNSLFTDGYHWAEGWLARAEELDVLRLRDGFPPDVNLPITKADAVLYTMRLLGENYYPSTSTISDVNIKDYFAYAVLYLSQFKTNLPGEPERDLIKLEDNRFSPYDYFYRGETVEFIVSLFYTDKP